MGSKHILASIVLGLAAVGARLEAETPSVRLTLQEALKTALDQNPRVHQSILSLASSSEDRRLAAAALLPQVSAEAFGQRNKYNTEALLGMRGTGMPVLVGPYNWAQARIEAQATLFDMSTYERWKASRHAEDSARAQVRVMREEIGALVVGQYLRALRADASVKASQSRLELAEALEKLAEDQQNHGIGTKLDTLRAQVRLQSERQMLIQAHTQAFTSRAGLAKLLNLDPETRIELADTLASPTLPIQEFRGAYQTGLRQRPELQALDAQERAAKALQDSAKGLRYPTLGITGSYGSTVLQPDSWANTYQITLDLKVPLFTGGLISSRVAKARMELDQLKENRREVLSQVGLEVRMAQAEMEAAKAEVETADLTVKLAEEALVQARHRFEAGVSNNIELINAQDDLAKANENQISALYRLNQNRADLAKATGGLEPFSHADGDCMNDQTPNATPAEEPDPSQSKAMKVLKIVLPLAILVGIGMFFYYRNRVSTDDAQVDGHLVPISSKIYGHVDRILVEDNQLVKAGETLVDLDTKDLEAKIAEARAAIAKAGGKVSSAMAEQERAAVALTQAKGADLEAAQATVESRRSSYDKAKADYQRMSPLAARQEISALAYDAYRNQVDVSEADYKVAQRRLSSLRQEVEGRKAAIGVQVGKQAEAQGEVGQARANLAALELQLSYTHITAPVQGVVTRKMVESGQVLQPGQGLMTLVPLHQTWITANFKETQLAKVHPGQDAEVKVDMNGMKLKGKVDSIAGSTGSRMSLLPPENAVGNFVKVVQRIPVKIRIDEQEAQKVVLRPGMNVDVTILTK